MSLFNKLKFWKKKEIVKEEPKELSKEIKKTETVLISDKQFTRIMGKLDKLTNITAKEETLLKHDNRMSNFISQFEELMKGISELKAKPEIDQRIIQKLEARAVLIRKDAIENEILETVRKMVLAGEIPFVRDVEKYIVKSETNPKGFCSRATMFKALEKLVVKNKLIKYGIGKNTIYRPYDLLSEEEKTYLEMVRKTE